MGSCSTVNNNKENQVDKSTTNKFKKTLSKKGTKVSYNLDDPNIIVRKGSIKAFPFHAKLEFRINEIVTIFEEQKVETKEILSKYVRKAFEKINDLKLDYLPYLKESDIEYFRIYFYNTINNDWENINDKLNSPIKNFTYESRKSDDIPILIIINFDYKGLKISGNVLQNYIKCSFIGKPLEDIEPLQILVYDKKNHSLNNHSFEEHSLPKELKTYFYYYSYCNYNDNLFISVHHKENNKKQFLFVINLRSFEINLLCDSLESRYFHSMIFVPENFLFHVGGVTSDNIVEYYNIETKEIIKHSRLNENRCDPSLCCTDNTYLFAFCGYNPTNHAFLESIERINLRKSDAKWEIIKYSCPNGFISRSFGIISLTSTNILIIGGVDIIKTDKHEEIDISEHIYNFDTNSLSFEKLNLSYNIDYHFSEKYFIPINEKTSAIIPLSSDYKVVLYSNEELKTVKLEDLTHKTIKNLIEMIPNKIKIDLGLKKFIK